MDGSELGLRPERFDPLRLTTSRVVCSGICMLLVDGPMMLSGPSSLKSHLPDVSPGTVDSLVRDLRRFGVVGFARPGGLVLVSLTPAGETWGKVWLAEHPVPTWMRRGMRTQSRSLPQKGVPAQPVSKRVATMRRNRAILAGEIRKVDA